MNERIKKSLFILSAIFLVGCARLFGWDIHAPGLLSSNFERQVFPLHERVALYMPPDSLKFVSANRGDKFADPQIYHVGEAFSPMMVEGMQDAFDEFVMIETKPTPEIMKRYQIPYLVIVRIKRFQNHVTWHGQAVSLEAETVIYNPELKQIAAFDSRGTSDAKKVFAKKGGPEVNLNAAIEENVLSIVQYLQDSIRTGVWK